MGREGPVDLATVVKVVAPFKQGFCGWVGLRTVSPAKRDTLKLLMVHIDTYSSNC